MSSDNYLHSRLQVHVDSLSAESEASARDAERLLGFSKLIGQVGNMATARARQKVMDVSLSPGGLLEYFHSIGGDERALQRMMAECIGTIDETLVGRAQAARDGAASAAARAQVLGEQSAALSVLLSAPDGAPGSTSNVYADAIGRAFREAAHRSPAEPDAS